MMTLDEFFREVNGLTGWVPPNTPVRFFDGAQAWEIKKELVIARHQTGDAIWIETGDEHHEWARRRIAVLEAALKPFGDWAINLKAPKVWQIRHAAEMIAQRRLNWPDLDPVDMDEEPPAHPEAPALPLQDQPTKREDDLAAAFRVASEGLCAAKLLNQNLLMALRMIADDGIENSRDPRTVIARDAIAKAGGR